MNKKIVIAIVTLFLIGLFALPAMAQSPVRAEVDRTDITSDDVLILNIIVENATSIGEPQFEPMDGFAAQGRSSSTQLSIINGVSSRQTVYQYSLIPTQLGMLTVPAAHVTVDGNAYVTDPIQVNVTQGNGQPTGNPQQPATAGAMPSLSSLFGGLGVTGSAANAPSPSSNATLNPAPAPAELAGQPFYIEAVVDNANPYQGEQVLYTFRFYQAENLLEQPIYSAPEFTGFWSVEIDGATDHRVEAGGRAYLVTQIQTALFPTVVGELTIEPSELTVPGGFFSQGMAMETQPIALTVKPLPADAPDGFAGAVGQFVLQTAVSQEAIPLDESVDWLVRLSGAGNIEQLPAPAWPEGDAWQAIDSQPTINTEFTADYLLGSAVYERTMIPTTPGELELPAIEYVYFNPETAVYETTTSDPHLIKVTGDVPAAIGSQPASEDIQPEIDNGLRPIKPATELTGSSAAPLTEKTGYWLLWLVPLFVLGGTVGAKRYQSHRHAGADDRRRQQAAAEATAALAQPDGSAGQILSDYVGTKLGQSVTGMTQTAVCDLLRQHGVDNALVERVESCLQRSETEQYAPVALRGNDALRADAVAVIEALEVVLG